MQSNVEFGYQLSICSGTNENHVKTLIELAGQTPKTSLSYDTDLIGNDSSNNSDLPWESVC
jgi:hypothetical protein